MHFKLHKIKETTLLACCDDELAGKTIKSKEIEAFIDEKFFGKKDIETKFEKLLEKADNINLFGKKCVGIAIRKGFIKEKDIIKIGKIPHVQIYRL